MEVLIRLLPAFMHDVTFTASWWRVAAMYKYDTSVMWDNWPIGRVHTKLLFDSVLY